MYVCTVCMYVCMYVQSIAEEASNLFVRSRVSMQNAVEKVLGSPIHTSDNKGLNYGIPLCVCMYVCMYV